VQGDDVGLGEQALERHKFDAQAGAELRFGRTLIRQQAAAITVQDFQGTDADAAGADDPGGAPVSSRLYPRRH